MQHTVQPVSKLERLDIRPPSVWLPSPEHQLLDPMKDKINTPVDARGLVDRQALIRVLYQTLHPAYEPKLRNNRHHMYWPTGLYPKHTVARTFREIPINSVALPQDLHRWLHLVTRPPEIPDEELMQGMADSYMAARDIFTASRNIVRLQRDKDRLLGRLPTQGLIVRGSVNTRQKGISRNRRLFESKLKDFEAVPPEARIIQINTQENMKKIAEQLALVALKPQIVFSATQRAA